MKKNTKQGLLLKNKTKREKAPLNKKSRSKTPERKAIEKDKNDCPVRSRKKIVTSKNKRNTSSSGQHYRL